MALVHGFIIHQRIFEMWPGQNQEFRPLIILGIASLVLLNGTMLSEILAIIWLNANWMRP